VNDWAQLYRDHAEAVAALVGDLDSADLARTVPATPEWTVHQVLAHLTGGPADAVAGRMDGAPGPEWTARHVAEREGRSVADLVAELRSNVEGVAASLVDNPRPAIVWDIAVHHADLHEALGRPAPDEHFWKPVAHGVAPMLLSPVPATVTVGDATYGAGGPQVTVSDYEFFRAAFSRRSRAQIRAWAGEALPPEAIDGLCIFGPRDDDQPLPPPGSRDTDPVRTSP